jgi:hypothetical protein
MTVNSRSRQMLDFTFTAGIGEVVQIEPRAEMPIRLGSKVDLGR